MRRIIKFVLGILCLRCPIYRSGDIKVEIGRVGWWLWKKSSLQIKFLKLSLDFNKRVNIFPGRCPCMHSVDLPLKVNIPFTFKLMIK